MRTESRKTPILESTARRTVRFHKATKAEAESMDQEAIRIVGEMKSNWLRLGSLIQKMIHTGAFEALGLSMDAWMTSRLGHSLSSAFSALRSVQALNGVPEEKLQQIGERNANALTYLPEKQRKSEEWLEKAASLPTKEFKQEVQIAIQHKTGLTRERFKTFSIVLPEAVYASMCEAEKKLARALGLDIEQKTGNRISVWEAWSQWVLQTDEETIKTHTEGFDNS